MKYRKKPVVIEAVQITSADFNGDSWDDLPFTDLPNWLQEAITTGTVKAVGDDRDYALWGIHTLEGVMRAEPGDWIIRGVKDELYPCKDDIFRATYEEVES